MADSGPALVSIVRQGSYLIASVQTVLDDNEMSRFQDNLIHQVASYRSRGVIIDVAALDVLDSFGSRTLRGLAHMARLCGAALVIVGIRPDIAFALATLGAQGCMPTALDLEAGLTQLDEVLQTATAS